jgi:hypothetical protein
LWGKLWGKLWGSVDERTEIQKETEDTPSAIFGSRAHGRSAGRGTCRGSPCSRALRALMRVRTFSLQVCHYVALAPMGAPRGAALAAGRLAPEPFGL